MAEEGRQEAPQERREEGGGEEVVPRRKIDIRAALSMIPPATQYFARERRVRERRIRLRFHNELKEGIAKINPSLARELGIRDQVEVVVAHRRRFRYKVELDEQVPANEIWVNGERLPEYGVADNTIVTVRAA